MKYISMKMEPKGSRPPMSAMTSGCRYHCRAGMGDGMRFTRHGLSGSPFQLRPTTCARMHPQLWLCSLVSEDYLSITHTLRCMLGPASWHEKV